MSHYALAAQRRVPGAIRFEVIRIEELVSRSDVVPLTDPKTATAFCAVVQVRRAAAEVSTSCEASQCPTAPRPIDHGSTNSYERTAMTTNRALTKCVEALSETRTRLLTPEEASALLAAVCMPRDIPRSRTAAGLYAPDTEEQADKAACAIKLQALRLMRSEATRLERDHAAAVEFGRSSVSVAVRAIAEARLELPAYEKASDLERLQIGAEAAAALADMVAAAGANKVLTMRLGGVEALLGCVTQHVERLRRARERVRAPDTSNGSTADRLIAEVCMQATRALGNLCYGWDVDDIKAQVALPGAALIVAAICEQLVCSPEMPALPRSDLTSALPCAALFRWQAHTLRNLAVRSRQMQDAIGSAGGIAALAAGLRVYSASAKAVASALKAMAYALKDHAVNSESAVSEGAVEVAVALLRVHTTDEGVVEASLMFLALAATSSDPSAPKSDVQSAVHARAVRCGALLAACATANALLRQQPSSAEVVADVDAAEVGQPADRDALVRSVIWLLATLIRAVVLTRPEAARPLLEGGVHELFGSAAGVQAQARGKVQQEVARCLLALDSAMVQHVVPEAINEDQATLPALPKLPLTAPPAPPVPLFARSADPLRVGSDTCVDDISDAEIARCVAVLEFISADLTKLEGPRYRQLRKALAPVHKKLSERDAAVLEHGRRRQLRKEEEGRRARQAALDRRHVDTTMLRKGRIERLKGLCDEGQGKLLELKAGADRSRADDAHNADGADGAGCNGDADCSRSVQYMSQVPDGAVRDDSTPLLQGHTGTVPSTGTGTGDIAACDATTGELAGSAHPATDNLMASDATAVASDAPPHLFKSRQCYACKARFTQLHFFYALLCPKCAALNYRMRHLTCDLHGRVALLTGARVKIGYMIGTFITPLISRMVL